MIPNKNKLLAISFDLDDTLWDNRTLIVQAEQALYHWLCHQCEGFSTMFTAASLKQLQQKLIENNPQYQACVSLSRQKTIQHALRMAHYQNNIDALTIQAFDYFLEQRHKITYWPDVITTLKYLAQHYPLFALTNGNVDIRRLSIGKYFSYYLPAEKIGREKSDPKYFRHMIQETGVNPQNILHIGNDPCHDVKIPRQVGIHTLWYNNGYTQWDNRLEKPTHHITHIKQLQDKIKHLYKEAFIQ